MIVPFPRPQRRGPIEATCRAATSEGFPAAFRGLSAAAPLKRASPPNRSPTSRSAFRGLSAAAPLKRPSIKPPDRVVTGFPRPQRRGPIEARSRSRRWTARTPFPRPQRRGPIEATINATSSADILFFPRPQRRGPIEAVWWPRFASPIRGFPRPQRRGPIEASRLRGQLPRRCRSFRGLSAAAPLKPPRFAVQRRTSLAFRGLSAAAPLKPPAAMRGSQGTGSFRGLSAAAPLKPDPGSHPELRI